MSTGLGCDELLDGGISLSVVLIAKDNFMGEGSGC
jgi:hypothetical protein